MRRFVLFVVAIVLFSPAWAERAHDVVYWAPGNHNREGVALCHIPPGNPENAQTIVVGQAAVAAHLAHGDSLGACPKEVSAQVVVPNSLETLEGDAGNSAPFSESDFTYQQVYDSSEFGFIGPRLITQLVFRPDVPQFVTQGPFSQTLSEVEIRLSTTSAMPDGLSTTFADNVGADETVVFSGELVLATAATGPAEGPKAFDVVIDLSTPFAYEPAFGNLLLEVRNRGTAPGVEYLDAESVLGDTVSRVFNLGSVNVWDSLGLVTLFHLEPLGDGDCGDIKLSICHVPPGNPNNAHTICIAHQALQTHLAHGDDLGACES